MNEPSPPAQPVSSMPQRLWSEDTAPTADASFEAERVARAALRRLSAHATGAMRRRHGQELYEALERLADEGHTKAALDLIAAAARVDPAGVWQREQLRSRLAYPAGTARPDQVVRVDVMAASRRIAVWEVAPGDELTSLLADMGFTGKALPYASGHEVWEFAHEDLAELTDRFAGLLARLEQAGRPYISEDHYRSLPLPGTPSSGARAGKATGRLGPAAPPVQDDSAASYDAGSPAQTPPASGSQTGEPAVTDAPAPEQTPAAAPSPGEQAASAAQSETAHGPGREPATAHTADTGRPTAPPRDTASSPAPDKDRDPRSPDTAAPSATAPRQRRETAPSNSKTARAAAHGPDNPASSDPTPRRPAAPLHTSPPAKPDGSAAPAGFTPPASAQEAARDALRSLSDAGRWARQQPRQAFLQAVRRLADEGHTKMALDLIAAAARVDPAGVWQREQLRSRLAYPAGAVLPDQVVRIDVTDERTIIRGVEPEGGLAPLLQGMGWRYSADEGLWHSSGARPARRPRRLAELLERLEQAGSAYISEARYAALSATAHHRGGVPPEQAYANLRANLGGDQRASRLKFADPPTPAVHTRGDAPGPSPAPDRGAQNNEAKRRRASSIGIELTLTRPPAPQPTPRRGARSSGSPDQDGQQQAASTLVRLDARDWRAKHRKWGPTLRSQGRAEAIKQVDKDVHTKMLKECRKAFDQGKDVQLILPANDAQAIADYINLAREHGYAITLAVRVSPDAKRELDVLGHLHEHILQGSAHQAITPAQQRAELATMQTVLTQAHADQLVDKIMIYPADSTTPAYVNELRTEHDQYGNRTHSLWRNSRSVTDAINDLRRRPLSAAEQHEVRQEVTRIGRELPSADQVTEKNRPLREEVARGLNQLAQAMGMDPIDPDLAQRATVTVTDQPTAKTPQAPPAEQGPAPDAAGEPSPPHAVTEVPPEHVAIQVTSSLGRTRPAPSARNDRSRYQHPSVPSDSAAPAHQHTRANNR
ncbi:hypothetical protein GCM10027294_53250 [Marinactinospora endophytica]